MEESQSALYTSLMMIIKYYLKQLLCYKLSRAGTGLCSARGNLSPDEVFRIAVDCQCKVHHTNNFPLEKLKHGKTYWRLHCNTPDGSGVLVKLALFPRFQMDWVSIPKWPSVMTEPALEIQLSQQQKAVFSSWETTDHLSILSLCTVKILLEKGWGEKVRNKYVKM